jgi:pyridoxine kinase
MKTVLSIQSQVTGARVGNSVAAFAMERLGVRVLAVPTTLLGRRPDRGPPGGGPIAAETLASILAALEADGRLASIDAIISGYLAAPSQAEVIASAVARIKAAAPNALYVCDPVLGDDGKLYVSAAIVDAIQTKLLPSADLIAPNAFELGVLAQTRVTDLHTARAAIERVGKPALVSSIPHGPDLAALLVRGGQTIACTTPRLPSPARGAGDLFAALFVAQLLQGESDADALASAMAAAFDVIAASGDDLALPEMQELLVHPRTAPRRIEIGA